MKTNRREFMKTAVLSAAGLSSSFSLKAAEAGTPAPKKRPNLVYVFPDQMRRHAMGFMKADPVLTPNIDAFAKRGVVLDNACSTYPVCSPHRAMVSVGIP